MWHGKLEEEDLGSTVEALYCWGWVLVRAQNLRVCTGGITVDKKGRRTVGYGAVLYVAAGAVLAAGYVGEERNFLQGAEGRVLEDVCAWGAAGAVRVDERESVAKCSVRC